MKLRLSLFALVFPLLALGLASARAANPLKSLGSSLKKAGQVLTPWKTPSPAPFTQPSSPAKPAAYPARPAPQTPAARPIAAKPIAAKPIAARPIAKPFAPQLATAKPAPAKPTAKHDPFAGLQDDLDEAVNYAAVYAAIQEEVTVPRHQLIEVLTDRIARRVLRDQPRLTHVTVRVHKPFAPLPGVFRDVYAELTLRREDL